VIENRKMTNKTLAGPDWRTMLLLPMTIVIRVMILKEMIQAEI